VEGVQLTAIQQASSGNRSVILITLEGDPDDLQDLAAIRDALEIISETADGQQPHEPGLPEWSAGNVYTVSITPVLPETSTVKARLSGDADYVSDIFDFSLNPKFEITFGDGIKDGAQMEALVTASIIVTVTAYQSQTAYDNGVVYEDFVGRVRFVAEKGGTFSKDAEATFEHGKAFVQLNAASSVDTIRDTIIANLLEGDGLITEVARNYIDYVPRGGDDPGDEEHISIKSMYVLNAYSVYVTFNKEYNPTTLRNSLNSFVITRDSLGTGDVTPVGFTPHATRDANGTVTEDKTTVRLELLQRNALRDNTLITLSVTGDSYVNEYTNTRPISDTAPPTILTIDTAVAGAGKLRAIFSEPVVTHDWYAVGDAGYANAPFVYAGNIRNWKLNGNPLTPEDIVSIEVVADTPGIDYVPGPNDLDNKQDNRCWIDIELTVTGLGKLIDNERYPGVKNLLEISNVRDFAGLTDSNGNTAQTQSFEFLSPNPPEAPKYEVIQESVEQFRIRFDQPLTNFLVPANIDFRHQTGVTTAGDPIWTRIQVETSNSDDRNIVSLTSISRSEYLLELNTDWTLIKNTYAEDANPGGGTNTYHTNHQDKVKIAITSLPANKVQNVYGKTLTNPEPEQSGTPVPTTERYANPHILRLREDAVSPEILQIGNIDYDPETVINLATSTVSVKMDEPVQINASRSLQAAIRTTPLSPNVTQMAGLSVGFTTTNLTDSSTKYLTSTTAFPYNGISPVICNFVREADNTVIPGRIVSVDSDDFTFTVGPTSGLTRGEEWHLTIAAITDDVGNTAKTATIKIKLTGDPPVTHLPQIVWATANDNIYDFKDDLYIVGDEIHVQYNQEMSPTTVGRSQYYSVNGVALPPGLSVSLDPDAIYAYETDGTPLRGTLATIHIPYYQLSGESQQPFITQLLGWDPASPYDPYDPDKPWKLDRRLTTLLTVDAKNITSMEGVPLNQGNPWNDELTYRISNTQPILPHVHAYVNSLVFDTNRLDLASLDKALDSEFVNHITPAVPFYTWQANVWTPTTDLSNINFTINYTNTGDFSFSAPIDSTTKAMKPVGDVTITADNADTITVEAPIDGDLTINSITAKEVYITGLVSGTLTLDVPAAHIYLNSIEVPPGTGGIFIVNGFANVVITAMAQSTLTISGDVAITTLTLHCGGTIESGGTIDTLVIDTTQTVVLAGVYTNAAGNVQTTITLNVLACVVNETGATITVTDNSGVLGGGAIQIGEDASYPANLNSGQQAAVTSDLLTTIGTYATLTSLENAWGTDLFKLAGYTVTAVENKGGSNGLAITNALIAYNVATSTSLVSATQAQIQSVIDGAVTALGSIEGKAGSGTTGNLTAADMPLFAKAGIKLTSSATTGAINTRIKEWLTPRTFENLQTFINKL
jgi:hypothetical protein